MTPRVAIVIPVFGHSALAGEAIASALAVAETGEAVVVAVDDGCRNAQTREALDGWARTGGARFHRLHQANRGLSGARNAGIRFALDRYRGIEAVFLLDADNRLDAHAGAVFADLLDRVPAAAWFYPNFDMFGLEASAHNGRRFSLALMAASNQCEAGSLVRRRVFDAGVWFAEDMRAGYEDWDFWLQAAHAGFSGHPVEQAFFRYRKRPESMLSGSHGADAALRARIRDRHRWLYDRDQIARLAAEMGPAVVAVEAADADAWRWSDPAEPERVPLGPCIETLLAARWRRGAAWQPRVWMFLRPGLRDWLGERKLVHSVQWYAQRALAGADAVAVVFRRRPGSDITVHVHDAVGSLAEGMDAVAPDTPAAVQAVRNDHRRARAEMRDLVDAADMIAVTADALAGEALPRGDAPARRLSDRDGRLRLRHCAAVVFDVPESPARDGGDPAATLDATVKSIRKHAPKPRAEMDVTLWRPDAQVAGPNDIDHVIRAHHLGGHPLPILGPPDRLRIGFVLPIFRFGGVEKCVVQLAYALRERGVSSHLFVYGDEPIATEPWLTEPFETVHLRRDPKLREWLGPRYLGTSLGTEPSEALMSDLLGPLTGMDAVVASGSAALLHGVGALRSKGVRVFTWEHLLETSPYGAPYGTPHLAVAYEGGLDGIISCSRSLETWLYGHGVPAAKLLALPNGPGFPMSADEVAAAIEARAARRAAGQPLRVGFLGRLDGQKGADRFVRVAEACRDLPLEFSITGKAVIGGGPALSVPAHVTRHPTAYGLDALKEAFARIDVLLMPSRDEGLPLTIMEAQRVGVVPIATDVGAVSEAIRDGVDGVLIRGHDVAGQMTGWLERFTADTGLVTRLAEGAQGRTAQWQRNADRLLRRLRAMVVPRFR